MGFDIECIIDINTYPGEYFCPVCRTLVYPNEALQAHCTHLYCKPCLTHIANGSKACPYDGYLVTESESKLLVDSDKTLAENIGKVKVHCLYFRSGCTWEGTLSDCISHCSECSMGNSPVICNRCGVQIVHRQVHDHAHSCPGGSEAQQVAGTVSGVNGSSASSATTAVVNQTASQSGGPHSQAQNPQVVASTSVPAQNSAQQVTTSQSVVAPGAVPTTEQWYQQQNQQYYQQYVGYEPYQQPNQQYYPLQQQPFQQYPQHLMHVQGQPLSHVHTQAQQQPQLQNHLIPQTSQPHIQPQAQVQAQSQAHGQDQPHAQAQLLSQAPPQVPIPPQGQGYVHAPFQASTANYQINPQQPHPPMRPPTHLPPQSLLPPAHNQPTLYSHSAGTQPPPVHDPQVPQYQQPNAQIHYSQATQPHIQPHMHVYPQPQTQPIPPSQTQASNHSYAQPQAQLYHTQPQPQPQPQPPRPSQVNQPNVPASAPQLPHQPIPPVSGHHSYQPPHLAQQMQSGVPQQHPMHPQASSGSLQQVQIQVPQQPLAMWQPQNLGSVPVQQSSTPLPPPNQISGIQAQYQQFPSHVQPPGPPLQQRPAVPSHQSVPQTYFQQPFTAPFQVQQHQQGQFPNQPPQPPRPYPPLHPQKTQNFTGRPLMPSPGTNVHNNQQLSDRNSHVPPAIQVQLGSRETSRNQNNLGSPMHENISGKEVERGSEVEPIKTEAVIAQQETVSKNEENGAKDGLVKHLIKQEDSGVDNSLEQPSLEKSLKADEFCKENNELLTTSNGLKQKDIQETGLSNDQRLVEGGSLIQTYGIDPSFSRLNGASGSTDKAAPGQSRLLPQHHNSVGHVRIDNFGPGSENHKKQFAPGSPDREYRGISPHGFGGPTFDDKNGREAHRFGEGYKSFHQSSDRGNIFQDSNFPPIAGHMQRGEIDGPGNMRFVDHTAPRPPHNHIRSDDFYGQDGQGHLMGGEFSSPHFPGRFNTGENHGPRAFPRNARVTELGGPGNFSGMRNNYPVQGFPNAPNFSGGVDSFDPSRKRRPMSTGWCRICMFDCETVEGLDMHSQTREHQNMSLDMVKTIKQQNRKKQRSSGGNFAHDGGMTRRVGPEYRGSKY